MNVNNNSFGTPLISGFEIGNYRVSTKTLRDDIKCVKVYVASDKYLFSYIADDQALKAERDEIKCICANMDSICNWCWNVQFKIYFV